MSVILSEDLILLWSNDPMGQYFRILKNADLDQLDFPEPLCVLILPPNDAHLFKILERVADKSEWNFHHFTNFINPA